MGVCIYRGQKKERLGRSFYILIAKPYLLLLLEAAAVALPSA